MPNRPRSLTPAQRDLWARWGGTIADARRRAGLSQPGLADRLGVTDALVSAWETGRRIPGLDRRKALCDLLSIPPADLGADRDDCPCCGRPWR